MGILQQPPTPELVNQLMVSRIASKWFIIGTYCGIKDEALKDIERDNAGDVVKCCFQMFEFWLCKDPATEYHPRTWDTLLTAVKKAHGVQTYENIMCELLALVRNDEVRWGGIYV